MLQRLRTAMAGGRRQDVHRPPATARRATTVMVGALLTMLWLVPVPAAARTQAPAEQAGQQQTRQQVLTWTADDSITSYASAPETATAGTATIVFENSAATGNTTGVAHTLTFDTTTPGYNHDVDLDITASPYDANGGRHEVQVTLTPGKYRYYCAMPGHGRMTGVLVVTDGDGGDTTAPQVSAEITGDRNADGDYVGDATVTLSAQDDGSGVDSVEYEIDDTGFMAYSGPVTVDEPGDHSVQYRATDAAGNVSQVGSVSFTVVEPAPEDTTAPEVSASVTGDRNADGDYMGDATVTLSAQDSGSGLAAVEYSLDGQPYTAYSGPVTVNEPGAHTMDYRATDKAGNTSAPQSVSFTVVEPTPEDTTAPQVSATVSGDRNTDGDYVGNATVTLSAQDSGSGVATVEHSLDGAAYTAYTTPVTVDQPGTHTVRYRATDEAGNTSTPESVSFTVVEQEPEDTTAPHVSASLAGDRNADGDYVGGASVTLTAEDAGSGVATVEYSLDGTAYAVYTDPITVNQPGTHTVTYRATDQAGNTSAPQSVSFTVTEPAPGDSCPDSDIRATVIIDGRDTGVDNVTTGNGCTINDLVAEDATYRNHGAFVRHVDRITDRLVADGVLSGGEKGRIMRAAGRSDIGR